MSLNTYLRDEVGLDRAARKDVTKAARKAYSQSMNKIGRDSIGFLLALLLGLVAFAAVYTTLHSFGLSLRPGFGGRSPAVSAAASVRLWSTSR